MHVILKTINILVRIAVSAGGMLLFVSMNTAAQQTLNPKYFYYVNGKVIDGWILQVSDPSNWGGVTVEQSKATSSSGKVDVKPVDYVGKNDAIQITWNRAKEKGQFSVYGNPIDLSSVKDKAALAFDLRVDKAPNKSVLVGMDCGYPCRAEFEIAGTFRKYPRKKWISVPLPLNCFKSDNFDLSKINGPLILSTDGKMKLSIANIRIERLPEGDKGCAE